MAENQGHHQTAAILEKVSIALHLVYIVRKEYLYDI